MKKLTKPQQALLDRVNEEGTVKLNGRARRTVDAIREHVNVEFTLVPHAHSRWTEQFTLTPKQDR